MTEEIRYIIARNDWSAKHILHRVRQGLLPEDKVLFKTEQLARERRGRMRPIDHARFSIFKIHFTPKEK